eukprot:357806-Chlamydomonas_euryale.AAC.1
MRPPVCSSATDLAPARAPLPSVLPASSRAPAPCRRGRLGLRGPLPRHASRAHGSASRGGFCAVSAAGLSITPSKLSSGAAGGGVPAIPPPCRDQCLRAARISATTRALWQHASSHVQASREACHAATAAQCSDSCRWRAAASKRSSGAAAAAVAAAAGATPTSSTNPSPSGMSPPLLPPPLLLLMLLPPPPLLPPPSLLPRPSPLPLPPPQLFLPGLPNGRGASTSQGVTPSMPAPGPACSADRARGGTLQTAASTAEAAAAMNIPSWTRMSAPPACTGPPLTPQAAATRGGASVAAAKGPHPAASAASPATTVASAAAGADLPPAAGTAFTAATDAAPAAASSTDSCGAALHAHAPHSRVACRLARTSCPHAAARRSSTASDASGPARPSAAHTSASVRTTSAGMGGANTSVSTPSAHSCGGGAGALMSSTTGALESATRSASTLAKPRSSSSRTSAPSNSST